MISELLIKVGMADLNTAANGEHLKTTGLGPCVGLTLFDPTKHVAGMAQVLLPSSSISREAPINVAKYPDTAKPELIERMLALYANVSRLQAKRSDGSHRFTLL